ncbi:MAG TPA: S41 family peptidase [Candidatus Limnocylindria bacterium]|nr:S41 family peptidase [Candidatus Limnocylindria bacterium]
MTDTTPAWPAPHGVPPQPPERRSPMRYAIVVLLLVVFFVGGVLIGQASVPPLDVGAPPTLTITASPSPLAVPATPPTPAPATPDQTDSPAPTPAPTEPAAQPTITPTPVPPRIPITTQPPNAPADFALFWEALEQVREHFVGRGDLADRELTHGAIRGLVDALGDTGHSVFLTPEALAAEQQSLEGRVVGIGVLLGERAGRPVIVSVLSGGPASRAGLRSGDVFISVDGVDVTRMAADELAPRVRGEAGTTVNITVDRPSTAERLEFSIVREEVRFPVADWTMIPGTDVALLRLVQFSSGAADQLGAARDQAIAAGARGLILDLRSNPGGFVHEAIGVASLFLDGETVYIREQADGTRIPEATDPRRQATDLPLVVLIDEGTASSAEIVSGAIGSAGRAEIVGQTTFGTGTVLQTFLLSDGSAVRLAVERWLTPDGELIFGRGISPTIEVALPANEVGLEPDELRALTPEQVRAIADTQLLRAIELLGGAP